MTQKNPTDPRVPTQTSSRLGKGSKGRAGHLLSPCCFLSPPHLWVKGEAPTLRLCLGETGG